MKTITLIIMTCLGLLTSCVNEDKTSDQDSEAAYLEQLYIEIIDLATSKTCVNSNQWSFVSLGSKPCGGPWVFIPYPTTIDVNAFLELVDNHKAKEHEYNITWGIISNCSTPNTPTGVSCINGTPQLDY